MGRLCNLMVMVVIGISSSEARNEGRYRFITDQTPTTSPAEISTRNPQQDNAVRTISSETAVEDFLRSHKTVQNQQISKDTIKFYQQNKYVSVWYPQGQITPAAKVALHILQTADEEGLNPADYKGVLHPHNQAGTPVSAVEAEIMLTNQFLKFIHDVRVGRIAPTHVARTIKVAVYETKPVELLIEALADPDPQYPKLKAMAPELDDYNKLKKLLKAYRQVLKKNPDMPTLVSTKKGGKLQFGKKSDEVVNLQKILVVLGFLPEVNNSHLYDKRLKEAVMAFQANHSIDADGAIGEQTRKALNWSMEERVKKIIANMERLRWLPDHLGDKFILVNVGGYEVLAINKGKVEHRIKAIVGKKSTRTPLFYAPLKNVIVNPSWGVPSSILIRDKIPKILKDPSYVERAGFSVYDRSGTRLNPYEVNWESEGAHMHLRQSPGAHNALGRIKFNIENPYTIYMHGTPQDKLFNKATRNFSSGCVRLQDPNRLAQWVLKDVNGWGMSDIQKKIKAGGTQTIAIKKSLPVYFTYLTVWVDDNGKSHFSPDAYDMDNALIKALHIASTPESVDIVYPASVVHDASVAKPTGEHEDQDKKQITESKNRDNYKIRYA